MNAVGISAEVPKLNLASSSSMPAIVQCDSCAACLACWPVVDMHSAESQGDLSSGHLLH
jgi:hypothetical protein